MSYFWIGRKLRHAHAPVGDHLHVNAHESSVDTRNCFDIHDDAWDAGKSAPDMAACKCGYFLCSKTGPCAPLPPPPKDELPEGWRLDVDRDDLDYQETYRHASGAFVWRYHKGRKVDCYSGWGWLWSADGKGCEREHCKPTRAEAMAAALASLEPAKPAEPELRPGWRVGARIFKHDGKSDGAHGFVRIDDGSIVHLNRSPYRLASDPEPINPTRAQLDEWAKSSRKPRGLGK